MYIRTKVVCTAGDGIKLTSITRNFLVILSLILHEYTHTPLCTGGGGADLSHSQGTRGELSMDGTQY